MIKHKFVSTKEDGPDDTVVRPGDWNADHEGIPDLKPWMAYDATGNQAITTEATLNIDTVLTADAGYTLSNDEVTINQDGIYLIMYNLAYEITNTLGSTRGSLCAKLQKNNVDINGSQSLSYHREASGGSSNQGQAIIALTNGDIIRIRMYRYYATTNIDTVQNMSSISILRIG